MTDRWLEKLPRQFAALLWLFVCASPAQSQQAFTLTAAQLQNGQAVELDKLGWKYSPADDPRFAEPQFDDSAWAALADPAKPQDSPSGWHGIGWFRLHLRIAPELANVALNLEMAHYGASEVYVNGRLLKRFGVVGKTLAEETAFNPNALPLAVVLQTGAEQVIAMRYSNQQAPDRNSFFGWWLSIGDQGPWGVDAIGFHSRFREFGAAASQRGVGYGPWPFPAGYNYSEATAFLAFGVLHLFLFVFFARQRSNLFCGLFLVLTGINDLTFITSLSAHFGVTGLYLVLWVLGITGSGATLSLLAFLYSAFQPERLRRLWFFLVVGLIWPLWLLVWPSKFSAEVGMLTTVVFLLEMFRVMAGAMRRKHAGARIVGLGILLFSMNQMQSLVIQPNILTYALGSFGLILALSIYLALEYARTNEHLEEQLIQVKQLSAAALEHEKVKAENERRAAELEEARQLQLSMLPKKLPSLPHLDIAVYMKTASEVGGDYYDFHLGEDGTLTVAVGDATGHGLKAGTMVTAVKSLFDTLAYHPDIAHIFERVSRTLKRMNLRGLFMALTLVKVRGQQLTIGIAGMPPLLIYRAATGETEEIALRGLPLGGVANYAYRQAERDLAAGDVLLLLSDGLPERFNTQGEMLDYAAVQRAFAAAAHYAPQQIIEHLVKTGDDWAQGHPQDDDVTFVVLKIKTENG